MRAECVMTDGARRAARRRIADVHDAAMLWSGGKDSALALHEAVRGGYRVRCLVTFAPPGAEFLAHPLPFIAMQARALALPHRVLTIEAPYEEAYEKQLRGLRDELNVTNIVTGDLAEVNGFPNWIRERCRPAGLAVHAPLWGRDRGSLLRQLLIEKFGVRFSCVDMRRLPEDWAGRELNECAVAELRALGKRSGIDPCGEAGEFHTLATDGPPFEQRIHIRRYSRRREGPLACMEIQEAELCECSARLSRSATA